MSTRRERIMELLENTEQPLNAQFIRNRLEIESELTVYEDLEHIAKSLKNAGKQLLIQPAVCNKCGFVFRARETIHRPKKCPKCNSEWISQPAFIIRPKGK